MTTTEQWWHEHVRQAGDNLEEFFSRDIDIASFGDAMYVARNVLLLACHMLVLDPSVGESQEEHDAIWKNLLRLHDLAKKLYEQQEGLVEADVVRAKYTLAHFEAIGSLSFHALMACRFALSAILMVNASVVIPEMYKRPGPEAWCLAMHAYQAVAVIGEEDYEGRPEESFWVTLDLGIVESSRAHQVNNLITQMGGNPVSPN